MKVSELREALEAKGIKTTTRMRKPELEKMLHDANLEEVTTLEEVRRPRREYPLGGNVASARALRRRQPAERDRQKRQRQIKRLLRSQGETVCMNPGTRPRKRN